MGLFQKASNNIAYLKEGIFGLQGTGKTYTAVKQAIFLWKYLEKLGLKPGPVAMFDTENGSAFAEPEFRRHNVPFYVFRGRAFAKLIEGTNEVIHKGFSILIVDSATHVWQDIVDSYILKKQKRTGSKYRPRLAMHDWGPIKAEWAQFPNLVVNAPIHMFVLGRAGFEYDTVENEDGGYDSIKVGTKFKAEGEFGFEPSLVFEMTRVRFNEEGVEVGKEIAKKTITKGGRKTEKSIRATVHGRAIEKHRAYCVKDRNMNRETTLDGKFFDFDPGDAESAPFDILVHHLACLNIGGENQGLDMSDSTDMFGDPDKSRQEYKRQCEIAAENVKDVLVLAELDGRSDAVKRQRVEELRKAFGTSSWTAITSMKLDDMLRGHALLAENLGVDLTVADGKPDKKPENQQVERPPREKAAEPAEPDWSKVGPPPMQEPPPSNEDDIPW